MSPTKKVIKFRRGRPPQYVVNELKRILVDIYCASPLEFISGGDIKYICFNDVCILYTGRDRLDALDVIYEGKWVGLYTKNTVAPSISVIRSIYDKHGVRAAIVVSEKALKAFLYGRDILSESVVEIIPPRGRLYSVIDPTDSEVVGFVKWSDEERVYKNIYDAGIFIRALS